MSSNKIFLAAAQNKAPAGTNGKNKGKIERTPLSRYDAEAEKRIAQARRAKYLSFSRP